MGDVFTKNVRGLINVVASVSKVRNSDGGDITYRLRYDKYDYLVLDDSGIYGSWPIPKEGGCLEVPVYEFIKECVDRFPIVVRNMCILDTGDKNVNAKCGATEQFLECIFFNSGVSGIITCSHINGLGGCMNTKAIIDAARR